MLQTVSNTFSRCVCFLMIATVVSCSSFPSFVSSEAAVELKPVAVNWQNPEVFEENKLPARASFFAFENMQKTFTKNDGIAFIVSPKDGVVFKENVLAAIHALSTESWQIPYASRVDSITNYQHTTAVGDDLIVEDLVLEPELLPDLDLEKI